MDSGYRAVRYESGRYVGFEWVKDRLERSRSVFIVEREDGALEVVGVSR